MSASPYDGLWSFLTKPPGDTWDEADDRWLGYQTGASGTLSAETIRKAFDDLWNYRPPLPPPGYLGSRKPFGLVPVTVQPPEWTVEAGGYRLVIEGGAIVGLARIYS